MTQKSKRQQQREQFKKQRARQRLLNNVIIAAVVVAALGIFVAMFRDTNRADIGEAILAEGEVNHVDPGTDVEYNSNPPTSGSHYDQPMNAGFYEDGSIETQVPFPESHIVHSLEHGYVVIWYNCDVLETAAACDELKDQVRTVMDRYNNLKIIAFPWHSIEVPLAMTSWERLLLFESFDAELVGQFIEANRSNPRAPEPNVP